MALTARNPFLNLTPDGYASDSDASTPLPVPGRPRLLASPPVQIERIGAPQVGNIITQPLSRLPQLTDSRIKDPSGPALGRLPSRIVAPGTDMSMPSEPMQRLGRQRAELSRLETTGDGISQIKNPFLRGLARVGDIAGTVLAPNVAAAIPGTSLHHRVLEGQQAQLIGQTEDSLKDDADIQQRQALAAQERAKARQLDNPMPKPGQLLYDKNGSAIGYQDGYGQYFGPDDEALPEGVKHVLSAAQRKEPTNAFELWHMQNPKGTAEEYLKLLGDGKIKSLPEQYNDALQSGDQESASRILKVIRDTQTQPKIDVHAASERPPRQLAYVQQPDGTTKAVEVTPGMTLPAGSSKTPDGREKISADEQKRADLARNLNENIDALEDILGRRPDLFGPIAGRWTQLRNLAGTDDPDVAQLMTIEHQLGMVAQGAHGMRSAQGVAAAAQSLTNGFHNSPAATKAALESAKKSVGTFLGDSQAPGQARYAHIAVGPGGHEIGSNDGKTWYDTRTGKKVQ